MYTRNFKLPLIYRVACLMYLGNLYFSIVSEARVGGPSTRPPPPSMPLFSHHWNIFNF